MSKTNGEIIVSHLPFLFSIPRVGVQEGRGPIMDSNYGGVTSMGTTGKVIRLL